MTALSEIRSEAVALIESTGMVLTPDEWSDLAVNDFGLGDIRTEGFVFVDLLRTPVLRVTLFVLLPFQTLPEHYHPAPPGKEETLRVLRGETRVYTKGTPNSVSVRIPQGKERWYTARHETVLGPGAYATVEAPVPHWFQGGADGSVNMTFQNRVDESLNVFTDPASTGCPIKLDD